MATGRKPTERKTQPHDSGTDDAVSLPQTATVVGKYVKVDHGDGSSSRYENGSQLDISGMSEDTVASLVAHGHIRLSD